MADGIAFQNGAFIRVTSGQYRGWEGVIVHSSIQDDERRYTIDGIPGTFVASQLTISTPR